jgi:hypothetical protein
VVASHVFIVLGKKLGVLKGYNGTIHRIYHCGGVGYTVHRTSYAVTDDEVAYLDTSCHERDTIVDILKYVLRGEADTC